MAERRQSEPSKEAADAAKGAEASADATSISRTEPHSSGFIGRHRLAASINLLNNQISILQEELEQLETVGEASIVCRETRGPADAGWDRWFRGDNSSRKHKRWI